MQLKTLVCLYMVFPGVKCPEPGTVVKGRVTPSLTEYLYRDHIYVRCDQGYKLMMVSLKLFLSFFSQNEYCKCAFCVLNTHLTCVILFAVRRVRRLRVSLPCAKAMGSGTSLCQNATVCSAMGQNNTIIVKSNHCY